MSVKTAMVLLHEAKYKAMKEKITRKGSVSVDCVEKSTQYNNTTLLNEKNLIEVTLKRCQRDLKIVKRENEDYEKEYKKLKDTFQKLKSEMKDLKKMKENLYQLYSEAQIGVITNQKKNKIHWTDDDIKKAIVLSQMISPRAYKFLKGPMKFPLPCLTILKKWMTEKNIYSKPKRRPKKLKQDTCLDTDQTDIEYLEVNESVTETQYVDHSNIQKPEANENVQVDIPEPQRREDVETQQAIEIVTKSSETGDFIIQNVEGQNLSGSVPVDGELFFVYANDDNENEQYYNLGENCVIDQKCVTRDYGDHENGVQYLEDEEYVHDVNDNNEDNNYIVDEIHSQDINADEEIVHESLPTKFSKWELNSIEKYGKANPNIVKRNTWKLMCKLCMRPFKSEEELGQHVPAHYYNTFYTPYLDAPKPYVCEFCNEQVMRKQTLIRHHILHLGINEFKCWHPGCKYISKNKVCLSAHMAGHSPRRHQCPQCKAAFTKRKALREHFARRHSVRSKHRCHLCGAICVSEFTYHLHMVSHNKPPRFKCTVEGCSDSFYSRRALFNHKSSHRTVKLKYQCPHCPLGTFSQEYHLKRHLLRHEMYRVAQCVRCQKIFDTYSDYYAHIKTDPHINVKYTCVCNESFKSKLKMRKHKRICTLALKDIKDSLNNKKRNATKKINRINDPERTSISDCVENTSKPLQEKTIKKLETDSSHGKNKNPEVNLQNIVQVKTETMKHAPTQSTKSVQSCPDFNKNVKRNIPDQDAVKNSQTINQPKNIITPVIRIQSLSTASQGIVKQINQEQKVTSTTNLANNPHRSVVNQPQLQKILPKYHIDSSKIFVSQQTVSEDIRPRKLLAIKRTHDQQKLTPANMIKLEKGKPELHKRNKLNPEQKVVAVSEETYQHEIPMNRVSQQKGIIPMTKSETVIPVSRGNSKKIVSIGARHRKAIPVIAGSQQKDIVGPMIKLGQVTPQKDAVIPDGGQTNIITVSKDILLKKFVAPVITFNRGVITISKSGRREINVGAKKSNQNISKNVLNLPRSTLVMQTPEYSQHVNAWQDQKQQGHKAVTRRDMPHVGEI